MLRGATTSEYEFCARARTHARTAEAPRIDTSADNQRLLLARLSVTTTVACSNFKSRLSTSTLLRQ